MTYIPTNWKIGDTITAEKLNKLENAIANIKSSGLLVTITDNVMDKTAGEIIEAVENGVPVTFIEGGGYR